jgi:cellulose synthase/poly-beta-1,6-N-acetylglucosamine synthase-like glycosyltransferase
VEKKLYGGKKPFQVFVAWYISAWCRMMKVSVIVPVYNGEKVITNCLKALLNQNYPKNDYEIIVVDDGSTDNTVTVVKKFKKVKLIQQKHKGPAVARNLGVKHAKGSIVLFTDADCVPSKNWIKNMVEPFKDKQVVGVAGTYRTLNKESLVARFAGYEIEERHEKMKNQATIDFIGTYSAGYRKNIFLKFGGFDESFPIASGEDPELSFRLSKAGLKMVFQPKAFVWHKHPDNLLKYLRQKFWRGYWRIFLYKKHKGKMFKHAYTPKSLYVEIGLIGLTCLFLLLSFSKRVFLLYSLIIFLFSLSLTLPLSLKIFKKDKLVGICSPFIVVLRDFVIGLGVICGLLNFFISKMK